MIYLIDDKTNRQQDFGWDENKIGSFKDILISISRYDQIEDIELRKLMFSDQNIILFHESFFDNVENKQNKDVNEIRNSLVKFAEKNGTFKVIFFSGSYNSREINETGGSIPVSILYQNMDSFLSNYKENGLIELKFLFFGKNPEIENVLIEKRENSNSLLIEELGNGKIDSRNNNFIVSGNGQGFSIPFNESTNQTIFNKNVNDDQLNIKLYNWFSENEYDNLFIPLCFGSTLSDYNGLRLATHIRCTNTKNQLKPIFIYSFVDYSYLIENEYFDILKTDNVYLIEINKQAFKNALDETIAPLTVEKLSKELRKINLNVPKDIGDNHSIANQWAIYRWAKTIDANDPAIKTIANKIESNLYFKYLKTIYPISDVNKLHHENLKINYSSIPKVLYIDDEAEKGWYEIFCTIFCDVNKLDLDYLCDEFKSKKRDEIIEMSFQKIIEENIDLVILDFRLHKDDFENGNLEDITGFKILKKIKEYNKGIQVVIFSATNKIWNLQALQEAGANGFIIKESPENSIDPEFTKQSIESFISLTEENLSRSFLKHFFTTCDKIKQNISTPYSEHQSPFDDFKKELIISLKIICESAYNIDLKLNSSLDVVFLNCYNFLEKFKHFYVKDVNYKLVIGFEEVEMNRYVFDKKKLKSNSFIRNNANDNPSFFHSITAILIDYFEVVDSESNIIEKIYQIKESRNDYIHNDKSNFDISELIDIINVCKITTDNLKD